MIVDDFEIRGGGIVREALPDRQAGVRDRVLLRNYKWEPSIIQPERRAEKYNQKAALILVTGEHETDRKGVAKALEGKLFEDGKVVYFLGIGSVLYGVDADIERKPENRLEHMRRLAEVANLMLDAGIILVVAAAELTQDDLEVIKTAVQPDWIETIWAGDTITTDLAVRPAPARRCRARGGGPAQGAPPGQGHHLPPMVTPQLRSAVIELAREAGRATMTYYDGAEDAGVREKDDRSPVTLADEVAHDILVEGLRRLDPATPVVSEEAAAAAFETRRGWRRFWLVDPLDGTKEFIKRRAEFTVNVALIEDGEPVFGVVLAPALDLLYWAVKGGGRLARGEGRRAGADLLDRARAGHAAHGGGEPVAPVARAGGVSPDHPGGPPGQGGQLAQVLLGGRGPGRRLSPARAHHGVGRGGRATASTASRGGTASGRRR